MVNRDSGREQTRRTLENLRPLRAVQHTFNANPYYVWISIFFAAMASLLPWRNWDGSPDLLLVVLAFWGAHSAPGVGLVAAFIFGYLLDVHDTTILGSHAITYVFTMYCVIKIRKIMLNFDVIGQMVYMLPIFLLVPIPQHMLNVWLAGSWSGWGWMLGGFINIFLWLCVHLVLKLPWQLMDDEDAVV
ncbi:MAG: rod shape-determining protein MreD [Alcaligenaceae bacterium]|nr:rod shape-determining protein MreD [Alcaligenaceae bacterium]